MGVVVATHEEQSVDRETLGLAFDGQGLNGGRIEKVSGHVVFQIKK
jgi:hypothetical protein